MAVLCGSLSGNQIKVFPAALRQVFKIHKMSTVAEWLNEMHFAFKRTYEELYLQKY